LLSAGISDFEILRYRDDYRIFVRSPRDGDQLLKLLTEVLIGLGLKLNASKTTGAQLVVVSSIKADKLAWLCGKQIDSDLQKHLVLIHSHGQKFPNSGSLTRALKRFHERLVRKTVIRNPLVMISIAIDIAYHSPRAIPDCSAIVSKLLCGLGTVGDRVDTIKKIHAKLSQLPNAGHLEVWLQRISHPVIADLVFKENMCRLVRGHSVFLWNSDWISSASLKAAVEPSRIVNKESLSTINAIVSPEEIALFSIETHSL
jgi:RNA-directed DNA polymerase